jgi:hypothetical protein
MPNSLGRPPLEPRIKALEIEVTELRKQITEMYEYFNQGKIPAPQYQSQFRVFPGASPNSNGNT